MKERDLSPDTYLDPNFDYKKLTKTELKKILFENNVNVRSSALKQELLEYYKDNIFDKIEILKENKKKELQKMENIFQSRSSIQDIDLGNNSLLNTERVLRRTSSQGRAISNNSSYIEDEDIVISKPNIRTKDSSLIDKKEMSIKDKLDHIRNFSSFEETSSEEVVSNYSDIHKEIADIKKSMFSNVDLKKKTMAERQENNISSTRQDKSRQEKPIRKPESPVKRQDSSPVKRQDSSPVKRQESLVRKQESPVRNLNSIKKQESPTKKQGNSTHLKNLIEEDIKKMSKEPEYITPHTIRRDKQVEKPVLSNKEQLRRIIEEDMKKHPSRKLENSSMFEDSSFTDNTGTSFPSNTTQEVPSVQERRKKSFALPLILSFLIILGVIAKCLPYDNGNCLFCVKIPSNGRLVDGKLVCNKGFLYKTSLFKNSCVKDDTKEKIKAKVISDIIKRLDFKHGDYKYGRSKTQFMNIRDLTDNEDIISDLQNNPLVIFKGTFICSKGSRVSLRTFMHFYAKKILFIVLPFIILVLVVKYYQIKRRTRRENELESKKITKDVLNVLLRQLIVATSNTRFPEYVFKDQLRDVFGENLDVWKIVEKKVNSNSNVTTLKMEDKVAWQWIGPVMRRKESIDNIL